MSAVISCFPNLKVFVETEMVELESSVLEKKLLHEIYDVYLHTLVPGSKQ